MRLVCDAANFYREKANDPKQESDVEDPRGKRPMPNRPPPPGHLRPEHLPGYK